MKKTLLILTILLSFELYSQEVLKFSDEEFEFCLTKKCGENNCEITKIEVLKNGILKQTIKPNENYFSKTFPNDQLFAIEDMNFDGKAPHFPNKSRTNPEGISTKTRRMHNTMIV